MRSLKIALAVGVILMMLAAHQLGVLDRVGAPAELKRTLVELGPLGYVAFLVAYALLQPFGVPGTVFVWAAPLIWPWPVAYALNMVGTMLASIVGFSFSRFIARDWIASKIPERFRRYDDALERRAFATVFWLRFIFWMPPLLHAFFGISKVRFSTHVWASLAGYALPLLAVSYFGEQVFELALAAPTEVWVATGVAIVLGGAAWWLLRRRTARAS